MADIDAIEALLRSMEERIDNAGGVCVSVRSSFPLIRVFIFISEIYESTSNISFF